MKYPTKTSNIITDVNFTRPPVHHFAQQQRACTNQWKKKVNEKEDGIVQKQIIHSSHLLVPPKETEETCITFTDTLAQYDTLALRSVGSSMLELDIRQAR